MRLGINVSIGNYYFLSLIFIPLLALWTDVILLKQEVWL